MYYYVYRLDHIETSEFYIGSRGTHLHPTLDTYMGSMVTWKPDKTKLIKTIIKDDFKNRSDAVDYEVELIMKCINESLNRNYNTPNKCYYKMGVVAVKAKDDPNEKIFLVHKDDPRYLSGELIGFTTGKLAVKEKNSITNKYFLVSKDDPRYLSGELVYHGKNKFLVKDKNNRCTIMTKDDPRYLSGEYILFWKGRTLSHEHKTKIGKGNKIAQTGSGNSQYGTIWINNNNEIKKIKKTDLQIWIDLGWKHGRKIGI